MNNIDMAENNAFPRENGATYNPVEVERSRRLYLKRLGVIICFVLIFMDGGTPRSDIKYLRKEDTVSDQSSNSQSLYAIKLNKVINSKRNLNIQNFFPRNISGVFHGMWAFDGSIPSVPNFQGAQQQKQMGLGLGLAGSNQKVFMLQLKAIKLNNVPDLDFVYGVVKIYRAGAAGADLFYPLQGVFMATTGTLHLLSSTSATEALYLQLPDSTDYRVPEVVVHSARDVELERGNATMANDSLSENARTFINRSAIDKNLPRTMRVRSCDDGLQKRMRRMPCYQSRGSGLALPIGRDDFGSSSSDLNSVWAIATGISQFPSVDSWLKILKGLFLWGERGRSEAFRAAENPTQQNSKMSVSEGSKCQGCDLESFSEIGGSRLNTLGTTAGSIVLPPPRMTSPQSLEIGSTGMSIRLIDLSQLSVVVKNQNLSFPVIRNNPNMNPNLIQAIGESALPETFKGLQRDATKESIRAMGLNTVTGMGSSGISQLCQFSINIEEAPMETTARSTMDQQQQTLFDHLMPGANINKSSANDSNSTSGAVYLKRKEEELARNEAYATAIFGRFESSSCNVAFNISGTSLRMELAEVERKASNYSFAASSICFIQIALLVLQMRYSRTQAASTKISILCISAQSMLDAALCIAHLVLCAVLPQVFFAHFMWVTILKLLLFGVLEMRTIITIYQARYAQDTTGLDGLRQRLAKVHLRFYAALFASIIMAIYCRSVPIIAVFIFYSYWVPQIIWNIVSGTRRTFNPLYCIGTTASRLFIPLYLFGCPDNFFAVLLPGVVPFSPGTCVGLVIWSVLQMIVLLSQDLLGPRFCLPASLFPRAYDYHRQIPAHVLRGSHSPPLAGSVNTGSTPIADVESGGLIECVICYNAVETDSGNYMITPCDHLFHKHCLEQWLTMKMECCICRSVLPAIEDS